MEKLAVEGGRQLAGRLRIHGAKNAALPILAATVLANGQYSIKDVPHLTDITVMLDILAALGAATTHQDSTVTIDTRSLQSFHVPKEMMGQMRSSIFLTGPLLARFGEVMVYPPGGCAIGERKVDLHFEGLKALGASVTYYEDHIWCTAKELQGADIHLAYPSVGATENIMMAATLAKGKTTIRNAAREPEIIDLQNFLIRMGARITGAGTECIIIEGTTKLHTVDYQVIPDRIVAGTMILAASMIDSKLEIENVVYEHISPLIRTLKQCGVEIGQSSDIINVSSTKSSHLSYARVITEPYPGFPTDMQAQLMSFLSLCKGTSVICETVFEGRFKHVPELVKLGANIEIIQNEAHIHGVRRLFGAEVEATDLRAGAALILAGLAAEGTTVISQVHHIDRGYERIEDLLQSVGAHIKRIHS
ncbi:MAG TPA: UDP-N-acetylglucosamine 1-carboxyvinyltransferase [Bacillota bacterium]|nr:UDP-N-acetylglucosamine 1-carboxyvinyltransferase [Bacillota bacterium]